MNLAARAQKRKENEWINDSADKINNSKREGERSQQYKHHHHE
jgi:hypothetical protein